MKAVRIHEYGALSVLRYEEAPLPAVGPGEVLVRVQAAAVNPADWQIRYGYFRAVMPRALPCILGWDLAGTVAAVGPGVTRWRSGEAVFAMADMTRDGAYAEFIAVRAEHLAARPATLTAVQAAAVPLAALTARKALFDDGHLARGERVLIHAAAGGVGLFAVQLAHAAGAEVIATASAENEALVRALGADSVIDYRRVDFRNQAKGVDLVLDTVGGETRTRSVELLRRGGRLLAIAMPPPDATTAAAAAARGATAGFTAVLPDGARLAEIGARIDAGRISVIIDREYALADAAAAHERSESRRARGKIILRVAD
jgi:NADPH:quinone reductase-like Zn-dependent oxidoreductase